MIGGDGINDESNKTAPPPRTEIYIYAIIKDKNKKLQIAY